MHTIQQETINRYKKKYPNHTFREISAQTGIQLTRVFRIINGYEMKLSEYLAFQKVINSTTREVCQRSLDLDYINQNFYNLDEQSGRDIKRKVEYIIELAKLKSSSNLQVQYH